MRISYILFVIICLSFLVTGCVELADNFVGTSMEFYLKNDSSMNLYYELEGIQLTKNVSGTVQVGKQSRIAYTKQFEVTNYPFEVVKIYNSSAKSTLLFESNLFKSPDFIWTREKASTGSIIYTLVLNDENLLSSNP